LTELAQPDVIVERSLACGRAGLFVIKHGAYFEPDASSTNITENQDKDEWRVIIFV
jgi:hypothetical protein